MLTAYLPVPFLWAWATWGRSAWYRFVPDPYGVLLLFMFLCGLVGGFVLLFRVGQLLHRMGARFPMAEAGILALGLPLAVLFVANEVDGGPSSLTLMWELPVYPYGSPVVYQDVPAWFTPPSDLLDEPILWVLLVIPLWSASLVVRLLVVYRPGRCAVRRRPSSAPSSER